MVKNLLDTMHVKTSPGKEGHNWRWRMLTVMLCSELRSSSVIATGEMGPANQQHIGKKCARGAGRELFSDLWLMECSVKCKKRLNNPVAVFSEYRRSIDSCLTGVDLRPLRKSASSQLIPITKQDGFPAPTCTDCSP